MNDDTKNELLLLAGELQIVRCMLSESLEYNALNKLDSCIRYLDNIVNENAETIKLTKGIIEDETD